MTAGYNSAAKQAEVLGLCRATAWVLLNRDTRAGPTATVIKRILSSRNIPPEVRRKIEEYVEQKINGLYGHNEERTQAFRDKLHTLPKPLPIARSARSSTTGLRDLRDKVAAPASVTKQAASKQWLISRRGE